MLLHHLQNALVDLRALIDITKSDIADIKEAKHNPQFERVSLKEEKLRSFESRKAMIDGAISKLMSSNPDADLASLITEEQHKALDDLKLELNNLREINKRYAKLVLVVSNMYNDFLEKLVPTEMDGYQTKASTKPSFLEVRV